MRWVGAFEAAQVNMSEFVEPESAMGKAFFIETLSSKVVELDDSITFVLEEYQKIGTDDWMEPAELTLRKSLDMDHGRMPESQMSLKSFDDKAKLFKEYERLSEEKQLAEHKLNEAKAEMLLAYIKDILK